MDSYDSQSKQMDSYDSQSKKMYSYDSQSKKMYSYDSQSKNMDSYDSQSHATKLLRGHMNNYVMTYVRNRTINMTLVMLFLVGNKDRHLPYAPAIFIT